MHPHHHEARSSSRAKMRALSGKGGGGRAYGGASHFKRADQHGVIHSYDSHTKGYDVGKAHGSKAKPSFARGGRAKHKGDVNVTIVAPQHHRPPAPLGGPMGPGAGGPPPPPGGAMPPGPPPNPAIAQQALGAIAGGQGAGGMGGGGMGGAMGNPLQALGGGMPGGRPFKRGGRTKSKGMTAGRTKRPQHTFDPEQTANLRPRGPSKESGLTSNMAHWQGYASKNAPGGSQSGADANLPLATPTGKFARGGKITAGAETGEGRLQIGRKTMAHKIKARLSGGRAMKDGGRAKDDDDEGDYGKPPDSNLPYGRRDGGPWEKITGARGRREESERQWAQRYGRMKEGGRNWIAGAVGKHPGALHKSLGVPQGEKIPEKKLNKAAASSNPKIAKRAALAKTLKGLHHG